MTTSINKRWALYTALGRESARTHGSTVGRGSRLSDSPMYITLSQSHRAHSEAHRKFLHLCLHSLHNIAQTGVSFLAAAIIAGAIAPRGERRALAVRSPRAALGAVAAQSISPEDSLLSLGGGARASPSPPPAWCGLPGTLCGPTGSPTSTCSAQPEPDPSGVGGRTARRGGDVATPRVPRTSCGPSSIRAVRKAAEKTSETDVTKRKTTPKSRSGRRRASSSGSTAASVVRAAATTDGRRASSAARDL
mmetsp:Transcript_2568/g.8504  ORF Transcript_2568/g.8504 Transcript_2568/m.8504 type:complete len:249 (+) Transcript_2568:80-826(+)